MTAFTELCQALPNRWGRTTEERAGGIAASLERAKTMKPDMLGVSQMTINKHITWVTAVLDHAEERTPRWGIVPLSRSPSGRLERASAKGTSTA
ncbi:hypothetical protein P0F65_05870 [Sphingomonas sp. I4]